MSVNEQTKKIAVSAVLIAVIVICLGIAMRSIAGRDPSFSRTMTFRCDKGHTFTVTVQQVSDWNVKHYGQPMPCPECGSTKLTRVMSDDHKADEK